MSGALPAKLHLRLPATSANLGSGFDAAAVALNLYLDVEAEAGGRLFDRRNRPRRGSLRADGGQPCS